MPSARHAPGRRCSPTTTPGTDFGTLPHVRHREQDGGRRRHDRHARLHLRSRRRRSSAAVERNMAAARLRARGAHRPGEPAPRARRRRPGHQRLGYQGTDYPTYPCDFWPWWGYPGYGCDLPWEWVAYRIGTLLMEMGTPRFRQPGPPAVIPRVWAGAGYSVLTPGERRERPDRGGRRRPGLRPVALPGDAVSGRHGRACSLRSPRRRGARCSPPAPPGPTPTSTTGTPTRPTGRWAGRRRFPMGTLRTTGSTTRAGWAAPSTSGWAWSGRLSVGVTRLLELVRPDLSPAHRRAAPGHLHRPGLPAAERVHAARPRPTTT